MDKFFVENLEPNITRIIKALKDISSKQESNKGIVQLLERLEKKDSNDIVNAIKQIPKTEINEVSVKESQAVINKLQAINDAVKLIKLDKVSINEAKDLTDGLGLVVKAIKAKDLSVNIDTSDIEAGLARVLKAVESIKYPEIKLPEAQIEALKPFADYSTKEGQEEIVEAIKDIKINVSGGGGYPVVGLKDENNNLISPATNQYQDPLSAYKLSDIDENGYYGFIKDDGAWYIMSGISGYRYIKGDSAFADSWYLREDLTYDYFNVVF